MEEKEKFLSRWSRLKRAVANDASAAAPSPVVAPGTAAELPPLDTLDFSSDFTGFLQPQVEESMKRAALKKLFHSGQFNTMDGLDVYIDDYNKFEPIPEEMLRQMEQARGLLFPREEEEQPVESPETMAVAVSPEAAPDESPSPMEPPETVAG